MPNRIIDLITYLPQSSASLKDIQEIMSTESIELNNINLDHDTAIDNRFIQTCDEYGIERFEKIMNIEPLVDDTLEDRRLRCLCTWVQKLPYNYAFLENKISDFCNGDYEITTDYDNYYVKILVALTAKNQLDAVKKFVSQVMPCNITYVVGLRYNKHKTLTPYTHSDLSQHTHDAIRNEPIF